MYMLPMRNSINYKYTDGLKDGKKITMPTVIKRQLEWQH